MTVVQATDDGGRPPSWFVTALVDELPSLRRTVRSMVGDPGLREDVLQETLLSACGNWYTFDADRPLGPWLRPIVGATAARLDRRQRRRRDLETCVAAVAVATDHVGSDDHVADLDRRRRLRAALGELSARERTLLWRRHVEELPYELLAALAGGRVGATKMAVSRAHHRLRAAFEAAGRGEGRLGILLAGLRRRRDPYREALLDRLLPLVPAHVGVALAAVALAPAGLVLRSGPGAGHVAELATPAAVTGAVPLHPVAAAPAAVPAPTTPAVVPREPAPARTDGTPDPADQRPVGPAPGLRVGAAGAGGAAGVEQPTPTTDAIWYQGVEVRCDRSVVLGLACDVLRATPAGDGLEVSSPTGPGS